MHAGLMKELQAAQKQISDLRSEVAQAQLPLLVAKAETLPSGARLLAAQVDGMDAKSLQVLMTSIARNDAHSAIVGLFVTLLLPCIYISRVPDMCSCLCCSCNLTNVCCCYDCWLP